MTVVPEETLEEVERRLGIERECDDIREENLGLPASDSYYCRKEPVLGEKELRAMRVKFDRVAARYRKP